MLPSDIKVNGSTQYSSKGEKRSELENSNSILEWLLTTYSIKAKGKEH